MNLDEINSRIKVVNAESTRINNERQVNIGKRDALKQQLDAALSQYKAKYGVELTEEMITSELQRVASEKEAEVAKLESMIDCINRRDYEGANKIAGIAKTVESDDVQAKQTVEAEKQGAGVDVAPPVASSTTETVSNINPLAPQPPVIDIPSTPVLSTPKAEEPASVVDEPVPSVPKIDESIPSAPVMTASAPRIKEPVSSVPASSAPVQVAPPNLNVGNDFSAMMAPPAGLDVDVPAPPIMTGGTKINSFSNILSGSEFNP